ncbi:MAG: hypothetical protein ACI3V0_04840 [Faecousia sp.]
MNDYRFPQNKVVTCCFPLFLLALQMVARSTMYTSTFLGFALSQVLMVGIMGVIGLAFLVVNRKKLKQVLTDRRMILMAASALVILLPMIIKRDWQLMYFSILLCWLFGIFATYFTTTAEAGRWYVLIMTGLSVISLVGVFLLKPMVRAGMLPGNPFDSPGGWHMFNFGLTVVCDTNIHMHDTLRAFGIFREPGLYQIFLFIAIHLNNDWVQWKKTWQMWAVNGILFASMLTTFATGGVLALGLYFVFLFFDKGLYRDQNLQALVAVLLVFAIAFVTIAVERGGTWAYELVGMMEKIFDKTYSYTARTDAIAADAMLFLQHPIFGADLAEVMYSVTNNTATSPIIFAVFGIVGGCLHVLSWVAFAWKKERNILLNLMLMVILFVPFNTQNVVHDLFFWLFPVMALTEKILPRLNGLTRKKKV